MLIDLRNKGISGKDAENALVKAEITVNKKTWFHLMTNHQTHEYVFGHLYQLLCSRRRAATC
jgi:hypothetical protein